MKVIAGLGNPGSRYVNTRHNVGYRVVDAIASANGIPLKKEERQVLLGESVLAGQPFLLVKPKTFMNRCGPALSALLKKRRVSPQQLFVVHDDLDLPLGRIRVKTKGAHGGHNGIRSIISSLATHHFYRIKIGIGRPPVSMDPSEYVLGPFFPEELEIVSDVIQRAVRGIQLILEEGVPQAMNQIHSGHSL